MKVFSHGKGMRDIKIQPEGDAEAMDEGASAQYDDEDQGQNRPKGEKTTQSLITRIMIKSKCQGHECNLIRAVPRAYKQMNSNTVLFTLTCIHSHVTLGFLPSVKPKVQM